jgi:hypothetical protein
MSRGVGAPAQAGASAGVAGRSLGTLPRRELRRSTAWVFPFHCHTGVSSLDDEARICGNLPMELPGLEPASSWVRSLRNGD